MPDLKDNALLLRQPLQLVTFFNRNAHRLLHKNMLPGQNCLFRHRNMELVSDPYDHSLRIVDTKTVDLSRYGNEIRFGAFVSDKEAYFVSKAANGEQFFALNCETGEVALSPLDPEGVYGETLCEMYAQRLDSPEEGKDFRLSWVNLLLGKKFESCKLEGVSEGEIFSVSPSGNYVVASLRGETDEKISVLSKKKEFSLSSVLQEGEVLKRVDFVYENVIFLTVEQGERTVSRCYKICF